MWTELISVFSPRLFSDTFCPMMLMLPNHANLSANQLLRVDCLALGVTAPNRKSNAPIIASVLTLFRRVRLREY